MAEEFTATPEQEPRFKMLPQDSIHRARLDSIEKKGPFNRKDGSQFYKLIWWFEITAEGDFKGRKVRGETGAELSANSKFHGWAQTILARTIQIGASVSSDDFVGLPVDISIKHVPDWKDKAKVWAEVDEVMPINGSFDMEPPF